MSFLVPVAAAQTSSTAVSSDVTSTQLSGYRVMGPLASSAEVYVDFGIPLANLQSLENLEQQISTPGSPQYRQYLTPAEVAQDYLPTAQYQRVMSFIQANGLTVVMSALDSIIVAQGTEAQVSRALDLSYDMYSNGTYAYYSASGVSPLSGVYVDSSNITSVLLAHPTDLSTQPSASPTKSTTPGQPNATAPDEGYSPVALGAAYNATGLYAKGITGKGYTAGILDFAGAPYIQQQLAYFDQINNLPSADLKIIPIGPYNPSTGPLTGWDEEIAIDVESENAMAPGANIDLYIADNALPIAAPVAQIVQDDKVNDLSQSWGVYENVLSSIGPSSLDFNVILTDQYYLLGSAEGITFTAATGDRGGSTAGSPEGSVSYPATSPYVVAVGATAAYLNFEGSEVSSSYQTGWSDYGFVAEGINYGGTTGGVSILEPRPWYQSSISVPSSFPDGRMVPDVSLSGAYPASIYVFDGNVTGFEGGTSESSPLFAGLLTVVMQADKTSLGLINPSLYSLGESKSTYTQVYTPITFGYTQPWVASSGYNLVAGWGAPNIGEMAQYGLSGAASSPLDVFVNATAAGTSQFEFAPGATVSVAALIASGNTVISTGTFTAQLETLSGTTGSVALTFNAKSDEWLGTLTVPTNASGLANVVVSGNAGSASGTGSSEIFAGYLATFFSPFVNLADNSPYPFSSNFAIPIDVNVTDLAGDPITNGSFSVTFSSYTLSSNTYKSLVTVPLTFGFTPYGLMWSGVLNGSYTNGPMVATTTGGAYGYLPFINGADLQTTEAIPSVIVEPGAVGPGQTIFIYAPILAPLNLPDVISETTGLPISYDVEYGSNVTVSLVSPSGQTVSTAQLYANDFVSSNFLIQGYLQVPEGVTTGLYTMVLKSNLDSLTLGTNVSGTYDEQIWVSSQTTVPQITVTPSNLYEGQNALISAKIDYSNGTAVKYGLYTATFYPTSLANFYTTVASDVSVPLYYNSTNGLWTGYATLPSTLSYGYEDIDPGALYLSGPYDAFVTGISADAVPTTTAISSQQSFTIQPYLLLSGETVNSLPQGSGLAFSGDTISSPATLTGDLFLGTNTISGGSVTITGSQINGTLDVNNAQLTLIGVSGGTIDAQNSKLTLYDSSVQSLQLTGSQVSLSGSSYQEVSPSLPTSTVSLPSTISSTSNTGSVTVNGQDISTVSIWLDGTLLTTYTNASSPYGFQLPSSLQDGVHSLQVIVTQQDGLSVSNTTYFTTNEQISAAETSISSLTTDLSSAQSTISGLGTQLTSASSTINSLGSKLNTANGMITNLTYGLYALGAIAVIALGIAIVGMTRKSSPPPSMAPSSSADAAPPPAPPAPESAQSPETAPPPQNQQ